jgi:ribosomal protein S3
MQRIEIKRHRKFVKILKMLFLDYESLFLIQNGIKGIKFDIRGKLGVIGSSKKRHLSFNIGVTSFSKKSHRLEYRQGLVNTSTGVLGVTIIIAY